MYGIPRSYSLYLSLASIALILIAIIAARPKKAFAFGGDLTAGISVMDSTDDSYAVVRLKATVPSVYFYVPCTVYFTGTTPDSPTDVTLSASKLRFYNEDTDSWDSTLTLTIGSGYGDSAGFDVMGDSGSSSIGDAVITIYQGDDTSGPTIGTKAMTVFHFDSPSLTMTDGSDYVLNIEDHTATYGPGADNDEHAIDFTGSATLLPAGLDTSVPQLVHISVSLAQIAKAGSIYELEYLHPVWTNGAASFDVPSYILSRLTLPSDTSDNSDSQSDQWLYTSGNVVAPGSVVYDSDAPYCFGDDKFCYENGANQATYTDVAVFIITNFDTFTVINDSSLSSEFQVESLISRAWDCTVISSLSDQTAEHSGTTHAPPSEDAPLLGECFNDVIGDPDSWARVDSATLVTIHN